MSVPEFFLIALAGGFSGALMPGPLLTLDIEESMRRGPWTGPKLILGHAILELSLIVAILLGFSRVLNLDVVKGGIGLAGGAVLLWMAHGMLRKSLSHLSLSSAGRAGRQGLPLILAGAVISLSNPYWSLWWATAGLKFLSIGRDLGVFGVGAFFSGHILADLIWYSAVSFAFSRGQRLFTDRVYRAIVFACGLFLVAVGLWFIDSGLGYLGFIQPSDLLR